MDDQLKQEQEELLGKALSTRVIETEEEAREYLEDIKKPQTKEDKLEMIKKHNEIVGEMTKIWNSLPRKRKRKMTDPRFKKSNEIRRRLRSL